MNENSIKHVLKVALWQHNKKSSLDITTERFYTAGTTIIPEESFPELSVTLLPAIIYFPPDKDSLFDDYWGVAACKGPVEGGITTLPFSYRPWELRPTSLTAPYINEQWYTFVVMMRQTTSMYIPKDILKIIHKHLLKAKGYNTGFKFLQ